MPIDPSFALTGPEWQIQPVEPGTQPSEAGGAAFGDILQSLSGTQQEAADAARALATGEAEDPTAVVMAVERAQLAMQLASQIRTKAVEAAQDILHTQV
jgi:flagellar hook-basal body complex protein FliE